MQVNKRTIRQMKVQMKAYFPGKYALVVVERLYEQGIPSTIQQVYNFFNNIPVKKRKEILSAAMLLLTEAKERNKQFDKLLKETNQ